MCSGNILFGGKMLSASLRNIKQSVTCFLKLNGKNIAKKHYRVLGNPAWCQWRFQLSPSERSKKGGSNINWKKKSTYPRKKMSKNLSVYLSVCYKLSPQLSTDWQNRLGWNFFRTSLAKLMFSNNSCMQCFYQCFEYVYS